MNFDDDILEGCNPVEILDSIDLWRYRIQSCSLIGRFTDAETVLAIVKKHPELHIVTSLGNKRYVNRYVPRMKSYFLSDESDDPHIEWRVRDLRPDEIKRLFEDAFGKKALENPNDILRLTEKLLSPAPVKRRGASSRG